MECGICQKDASEQRRLVCVSCVQAEIYRPRVQQVQTRLSHEKSHTLVEAVLRPGNDGVLAALPEDADYDAITAGIATQSHRRAKVEREAVDLRIETITEKAEELRRQVEDHKRFITEQKQLHQQKRDGIATKRQELNKRKAKALEPVQAVIRRTNRQLEKIHAKTSTSRQFLCETVGVLCGLQHVKDRKGRSEYFLDGLPIPNLKDLNVLNGRLRGERLGRQTGQPVVESHELISASLDNVCLFLAVCCYYLLIRLPAEIVLQDRDFPHAALMQREASYKAGELRYPGVGSSNTSPAESRALPADGERGKPRILQLHKPLLQLQKQDHKTYEKFIEGAMLLAYNVAWLCRAQGGLSHTPSFDDACDIGGNLYRLVNRDADPLPKRRAISTSKKAELNPSSHTTLGQYSHASAWSSLAGHEGSTMFAPDVWRVSVTTLTDRLKAYLRTEAARSEWHIIDDTEWDDVQEHEQAVMVGGASMLRQPLNAKGPAMSIMTVLPHDGAEDATAAAGKGKGSSGWTKLRGRGGGVDA